MADSKITLEKLQKGEKLLCPKCGKAYIEPFGTTADKAHSFYCPKCDFTTNYTFAIDID